MPESPQSEAGGRGPEGAGGGTSEAVGGPAGGSRACPPLPRTAAARALREFRRPRVWLALWALMIGLVIIGSLLPADDLPQVAFDGFDKLEHFFGYAVLSSYASMLFARLRPRALAAIGLVAVGIGLEVAQGLLTQTREADIADALVNALGVLAGLSIAATPLARLLQRLDARWR